MKIITLKIPEARYSFFMELIRQLNFEVSVETEIPDNHKMVVRDRMQNAVEEEMLLWNEARKKLSFNDNQQK